jgi:hypothetical protein
MFDEFSCGCVVSVYQGRVRICAVHRLEKAVGDGGAYLVPLRGIVKSYPANGQEVPGWRGR